MGHVISYIRDLEDPRLAPYRNMKDRDLAGRGDLFIAEGRLVVQRLLRSSYPCVSILCAERKLEAITPDLREGTNVYVLPDSQIHQILGFKFHGGVMGIGRRLGDHPLAERIARLSSSDRETAVILPRTNNSENVGAIARLAAGFGARLMIVGEQSSDPFYRQAIRISMGTIFSLELHRSCNILADLRALREEHGFELVATVLDPAAEPLPAAQRNQNRLGLLFGAEADGLSTAEIGVCQRKVTIPMSLGTDSLNVSLSAAIFLYHFTRQEAR